MRLREATLLQAAHIIDDRDPRGVATVVNGIALCAIHHLAYDRNLLGIDPLYRAEGERPVRTTKISLPDATPYPLVYLRCVQAPVHVPVRRERRTVPTALP